MADTKIEWATKVWNFTRGCRRVSSGCGGAVGEGGCYAERQAYRFSGPGQPYEGLVRLGKHGPQWTGKGRFVTEKLDEPLRWRAPKNGTRLRIFVNSMSDLFFDAFTNEDIASAFGVMAACPQHDFLILTKRPERMLDWFRWAEAGRDGRIGHTAQIRCSQAACAAGLSPNAVGYDTVNGTSRWPWPLRNVWIGCSVEDQVTADERIPLLLETPAAVRFVSYEPALGPVDFSPWLGDNPVHATKGGERGDSLSGGVGRVDRSSGGRVDLENSPATEKPLGRDGNGQASGAASDRRRSRQGLPNGEDHGQRGADIMPCPPASLAGAEGDHTAGPYDQSSGRDEGEKFTGQFRASHAPGTNAPRLSDGAEGRARREESGGKINQSSDRRDSQALLQWDGDTIGDRDRLRSGLSNDLKDRARGFPPVANGTNGELCEPPITRDARSRCGRALDQIIVGGESGPGARPFDMDWARSVRDQCKAAGTAFFFKQAGSFPVDGHPLKLRDHKGGDLSELGDWPREYPGRTG